MPHTPRQIDREIERTVDDIDALAGEFLACRRDG